MHVAAFLQIGHDVVGQLSAAARLHVVLYEDSVDRLDAQVLLSVVDYKILCALTAEELRYLALVA